VQEAGSSVGVTVALRVVDDLAGQAGEAMPGALLVSMLVGCPKGEKGRWGGFSDVKTARAAKTRDEYLMAIVVCVCSGSAAPAVVVC
jgi:hypothetical protein